MRRLSFMAVGCLAIAMSGFAQNDTFVSFYASPVSFPTSPGHAFLMITTETRVGPREEAFGFYPYGSGKFVFVGWPGAMNSEFQKQPTRFSQVGASFRRVIDTQKRQAIYARANQFNTMNYSLLDSNCIDFMDSAAAVVGLARPPRFPAQTPTQYVSELKRLNTIEYTVRLFNVDDFETALVNGRQIARVGYRGDTGRIKVVVDEAPVTLEIVHENAGGPATWGYEVMRGTQVIGRDTCGTAGVVGCQNNRPYPVGVVWRRSFRLGT